MNFILIGMIFLVGSALFIWGVLGDSIWDLSGNTPSLEEIGIPIIVSGVGVFVGLVFIFLGFRKSRKQ